MSRLLKPEQPDGQRSEIKKLASFRIAPFKDADREIPGYWRSLWHCRLSAKRNRSHRKRLQQQSGGNEVTAVAQGILEQRFISVGPELAESGLMLAAEILAARGRSVVIVCASDARCAGLIRQYQSVQGVHNIADTPLPGQTSSVDMQHIAAGSNQPYQAAICLTTPEQLMQDYLTARTMVNASLYQQAIASGFGKKRSSLPFAELDYVLVDRPETVLLDQCPKPAVVAQDRVLPGLEQALQALVQWARALPEAAFHQTETQCVYTGHQPMLAYSEFSSLTGLWRSERMLTELADHALTACRGLMAGRDYCVSEGQSFAENQSLLSENQSFAEKQNLTDRQLQIMDPETGAELPGRQFPEWLQQLVQTKEAITVSPLKEVVLSHSYQALFRQRPFLAGAGCFPKEEAGRFYQLFGRETLSLADSAARRRGYLSAEGGTVFFNDGGDLLNRLKQHEDALDLIVLSQNPDIQQLIRQPEFEALKQSRSDRWKVWIFPEQITEWEAHSEQLYSDQTDSDHTLSQNIVMIGASGTGRIESRVMHWLEYQIKHTTRVVNKNRVGNKKGIEHYVLLPDKPQKRFAGAVSGYGMSRQQKQYRHLQLLEQVQSLQADFWLEDQWI